ncbi:unnamed protein product [Cyprideis torosa]|uniref:Uncharacterized protein n=1 Tax=Cyprideis torosa TaxID=163714 RepID=A0A7R8W030_9CRUS|nr:unnamed protein product [Cyprideis torosa]CAG0879318.1 unnamed protein product [Cyprideis torosa]
MDSLLGGGGVSWSKPSTSANGGESQTEETADVEDSGSPSSPASGGRDASEPRSSPRHVASPALISSPSEQETTGNFPVNLSWKSSHEEVAPLPMTATSEEANSCNPLDLTLVKKRSSPSPLSPSSRSGTDRPKRSRLELVKHDQLVAPPSSGHFLGSHLETTASATDSLSALEKMQDLTRLTNTAVPPLFGHPGAWHTPWFASARHQTTALEGLRPSLLSTKDLFMCTWCRMNFSSLADLTQHMRDSKCAVRASVPSGSSPTSRSQGDLKSSSNSSSTSPNLAALKEAMPLPRKLVRGQDVWLGKGAEQTRQILKCMWCGQSFKTLAEMATHMRKTQHYTNIISQEQLVSWKSPEENVAAQSHVSAVFTCKVCKQKFTSFKDLSNHMAKNQHHQQTLGQPVPESSLNRKRNQNNKEKKKKSLPVRKLLELERAHAEPSRRMSPPSTPPDASSIHHLIKKERADDSASVSSERSEGSNLLREDDRLMSPRRIKSDDSSSETSDAPSTRDLRPPGSALNAIEKLIEDSFDPTAPPGGNGNSEALIKRFESPDPERQAGYTPDHSNSGRKKSISESSSSTHDHGSPKIATESHMGIGEDGRPYAKGSCRSREASQERLLDDSHRRPHVDIKLEHSVSPSGSPPVPSSDKRSDASTKASAHPLEALQRLCEKTENTSPSKKPSTSESAGSSLSGSRLPTGGTILAFSWACNDAVVNDSTMKCALCDTPFISKGAYRHHLSKVHFVKDNRASPPTPTAVVKQEVKQSNSNSRSPLPVGLAESPQSKFLKYSEMAKQLSSQCSRD